MWIPGAFPVFPVDAVQSLSAYLLNSTCVVVVWSLCPHISGIKSFVIEWKNLNRGEQMKWLRVPPNLRKYFIYGECVLENVIYAVNWCGTENVGFLSSEPLFLFPVSNPFSWPINQILMLIRGLPVALIIGLGSGVSSFCGNTIKLVLEYWTHQLIIQINICISFAFGFIPRNDPSSSVRSSFHDRIMLDWQFESWDSEVGISKRWIFDCPLWAALSSDLCLWGGNCLEMDNSGFQRLISPFQITLSWLRSTSSASTLCLLEELAKPEPRISLPKVTDRIFSPVFYEVKVTLKSKISVLAGKNKKSSNKVTVMYLQTVNRLQL